MFFSFSNVDFDQSIKVSFTSDSTRNTLNIFEPNGRPNLRADASSWLRRSLHNAEDGATVQCSGKDFD